MLTLSRGCEPLTPDDVAEVIVFAAGRRENVVVADTLLFPSHQVCSHGERRSVVDSVLGFADTCPSQVVTSMSIILLEVNTNLHETDIKNKTSMEIGEA